MSWSSGQDQEQTMIHRHQTLPRYHHVIHRHCCTCQPPLLASHPLQPNVTSFIKLKYITYHNATSGGLSHSHGESAHKILCRSVQRFQTYACRQTDKHTNTWLITSLRTVLNFLQYLTVVQWSAYTASTSCNTTYYSCRSLTFVQQLREWIGQLSWSPQSTVAALSHGPGWRTSPVPHARPSQSAVRLPC